MKGSCMNGKIKAVKRDEWEIKEDVRAVRRAIEVFKNSERLEDVKESLKAERAIEKGVDDLLDGNIAKALGLGE